MKSLSVHTESALEQTDSTAAEALIQRLFPTRTAKRILLVNPPDADSTMFRFGTAKRGRYTNYPSYGLAVLAQQLRAAGYEVQISNLNHEILKTVGSGVAESNFSFDSVWQHKIDADIKAFRPEIVGVTCMFTMTHTSLVRVCDWIKEQHNLPIGIGGVHVSNDVERVLKDVKSADFAFIREGDIAVVNFLGVVNRKRSMAELGQVIVRDRVNDQRFRFLAECRPTAQDVDTVPALDLLDIPDYAKYGVIGAFYFLKPAGTRFATVLSNRGCRAQCTFCSVRNFNGPGVRQRSIDTVIQELEILKNEYGVGHVMWLDDDLLKDHDRAIALFNRMVQKNLGITWDATNGVIAASCTEEVIAAAAASGCIALNIGMESGNPQILRQVRKPGTVENFLAAAEVLRRYEQIHSSVFLMVGFPGETMRMVLDTINVARRMNLDWCRISQLQPLPNTPIYDAMVAQGLLRDAGTSELRFMGGAYGKQTEMEHGLRLATANFEEAFSSIPLDAVPTPEQVVDIWFYMNYHLNFHRLFTERRPNKLAEQIKNLENLSDRISPENGFAAYFLGYLHYQLDGAIDPSLIERLDSILARSPYWQDRLAAFGLSISDLRNCHFQNKDIPALTPGRLPTSELTY